MRFLLPLALLGCTRASPPPTGPVSTGLADVVGVEASGDAGAFTFSVTIRSDETGCDAYADWWEVVGTDGALLYRRILAHSHVDEQPFTRTGGPVPVAPDTPVWIRAHHAPGGYGGAAWTGSVSGGFAAGDPPEPWAELAEQAPLPDGCAF